MSNEDLETTDEALTMAQNTVLIQQAVIFNTLRILKKVNPGDTYYEAYLGHYARNGKEFYDLYMLLWEIGAAMQPKRILEIGTRTGISLCQLLSAYIDHSIIERVVCVDPFLDGFMSPALVKKNLSALNIPTDKIEFMTVFSQEALPVLDEKFDYILVDGDHTKDVARMDLEHAHRLIDEGGIIVFDDISTAPGECGLIDVWEAFMADHSADYETGRNMTGKGVAWAVRQ